MGHAGFLAKSFNVSRRVRVYRRLFAGTIARGWPRYDDGGGADLSRFGPDDDPYREAHGHGAPILLTHGFAATCRMWDEQIEEFTDRHRMIVWDLPGHGASPSPRDVTRDAMVARMLDVLDAETSERAVLIGLGLGSALSLRFWRAHAARVRALVLIGALPGLRHGLARDIWNGQVAALAAALERDGLAALCGGAEVDRRSHLSATALAAIARTLLPHHDDGALRFLADIDVPALILVGSEDRAHRGAANYMARAMPRARLRVITRARHAVNVERPAASNAAIAEFLRDLPP